jgi:uncharacterized protein (DUF362 family)
MSKIFVQKENEFTFEFFSESLEDMMLYEKIESSKDIIIKPNLTGASFMKEEEGAITPKDILLKVIGFISKISPDATIHIMESDSINYDYAYKKFENQNYGEIIKKFPQVKLYDATRSPQAKFEFDGLHFKKVIRISEIFDKQYFFISLAKAKTHNKTVYTGVLKNQFGCLCPMDKSAYHTKIGKVVSDINKFIKPDLSILEMCPAMEGNGPIKGDVVNIGLILLSDNPVALDYLAVEKMGLIKYRIKYLVLCQKTLKEIYGDEKPVIFKEELLESIPEFKYISIGKRFFMKVGIFIQKISYIIQKVAMKIQKLGE